MHAVAVVLACIALVGHSRRVQVERSHSQGTSNKEHKTSQQAFAALLQGFNPSAAWQVNGVGLNRGSFPANFGVKVSRSRSPISPVAEDLFTYEDELDPNDPINKFIEKEAAQYEENAEVEVVKEKVAASTAAPAREASGSTPVGVAGAGGKLPDVKPDIKLTPEQNAKVMQVIEESQPEADRSWADRLKELCDFDAMYPKKSELDLVEQEAQLQALADKWERIEDIQEYEGNRLLGFTESAEVTNGRIAMFFFATGLITEYYTGQSMPQQVQTLLENLAIIN